MTPRKSLILAASVALAAGLGLSACSTAPRTAMAPPVLPTEQFPLQAQTMVKTINLRINPNGLSPNQRTALDQVAAKANWINGEPVNVEIVTSGDPMAVAAGQSVGSYLIGREVSATNLTQLSAQQQPADIITINMIYYRAQVYDCNQTWENLAATGSNRPYENFGCAVNSNLAAQIDDPRDLVGPRAATPTDAARKGTVIGKYQKGEITSSAVDNAARGTISNAIN